MARYSTGAWPLFAPGLTDVIADNRLAELAGWDRELLKIELGDLVEIDLRGELNIDIDVIGFETAEIDILLDGTSDLGTVDPADATLAGAEIGPSVTRPGDLWILADHRILCADALKPESYVRLMGEERARLVFTDPPYNVPIDGHGRGLGAVKHREFAMAAGEMSRREFAAFLETALRALAGAGLDGALNYICMDWRHLHELLTAGRSAGLDLINLGGWNKNNGGMGSLERHGHVPCSDHRAIRRDRRRYSSTRCRRAAAAYERPSPDRSLTP